MPKIDYIPPTEAELERLERLAQIGWFDSGAVQRRVLHEVGWPPDRPMVSCLIAEIHRLREEVKVADTAAAHLMNKITRLRELCGEAEKWTVNKKLALRLRAASEGQK